MEHLDLTDFAQFIKDGDPAISTAGLWLDHTLTTS
jgi:hypothetical protein